VTRANNVDWNCILTEERLSDYLEGALLPEEQAALSGHVANCVACAEMMEQVGGLVSGMHSLVPVEEPPQLIARILGATVGARQQSWRGWFDWVPLIWQPRFAMGIATVAASLAIVLHAAGVRPTELTAADLNPANLVRQLNRQAHLSYARGVKFVNDLRVVYEIESRLPWQSQAASSRSEQQPESNPPAASPRQKSQEIHLRSSDEMAWLLSGGWPEDVSNSSSRSAR
jgi:Putative zinc-finger